MPARLRRCPYCIGITQNVQTKHLTDIHMARVCDACGKGPKKAAIRSHALNKTLRVQRTNLQKLADMRVCTRCRRSLLKQATQIAV